ncbi:MAG: DUF4388 domain-containing protein [Nitrospira sp.]|nr:DUF4388 domain-containing protein [Candidatus Manganitrophaceae bacterium]HIL34634.1 DUF4388 domain-containing protein [Candidatus Manganitrophaceae bacterium]
MALEGKIQEFELSEIFQMIQHQKKEGILALVKGKDGVLVQFKEGRIIRALDAEEEDALLNLLLKAEQINLEDVKTALDEQKRIKRTLAETLISLDIISANQLKRITRLYTEDMVFQLFEWKTGKYKFEEKKVSYTPDLVEPMSIEFTLMEGVRRVDEWPRFLKTITSRQSTFEVTPAFSVKVSQKSDQKADEETSFLSLKDSTSEEDGGESSWLLTQVSHNRNIQEMIDLAEMGAFSVYKGLVDLLSQGKIKKVVNHEVKVVSGARSVKDIERRQQIMKIGAGALVIASILFLVTLSYPSIQTTFLGADQSIQEVRKLRAWNGIYLIRHQLEIYRLRKGHYPTTLQELFREKETVKRGIDPRIWHYRLSGDQAENYQIDPM